MVLRPEDLDMGNKTYCVPKLELGNENNENQRLTTIPQPPFIKGEREGTFSTFIAVVLAIIFFTGIIVTTASAAQKQPKPGTVKTIDIGNGVKMDFVWCPSGSFMMGSTEAEQKKAIKDLPADLKSETMKSTIDAINNEGPKHKVIFAKGFWMAKTEVTQAQWKQVMGTNPSKFIESGINAPVETVSWNDCQAFIAKLNNICASQITGKFSLPTEAQWEYACRAGTNKAYYFGSDASRLGDYAWFAGNSSMKSQGVAQKKPNAWGLYDMHGNVWEWCANFYEKYPINNVTDPAEPAAGSGLVGRGGGWDDFAVDLRSAYRSFGRPADFKASPLGLRPVLIPLPIKAAPLSSASECSSAYTKVCLCRFLLDSSASS